MDLYTRALVAFTLILAASSRVAVADSNVLVFGDSLSDQGNLYAATLKTIPGEDYYEGRFSNGEIWVDVLNNNSYTVANYAIGGATACGVFQGAQNQRTDLQAQLGLFSQGRPAPKDSATSSSALFHPQDTNAVFIMIGGNDFLNAMEAAFNESLVPLDQEQLDAATIMAKDFLLQVRDKANKCILDQVKVLLQVVDPKKTAVYVANVPALEDAPATLKDKRNYTDEAVNALTDAIDDHSRALKAALESEEYQALVAEGGSLQFVDLHQMTKDIMATLQESNAVSNVEDACRPCASTAADCTLCESPSSHYYYDLVHPTESVHKLIGEKAVELIEANPRGGRWLSSAPAKDNNGNTVDFDTTLKLTDTISGLKNLINSNQAFTIFMPSSQALTKLADDVFPGSLPAGADVGKFFTDNPDLAFKVMSSYIVMKEGNYDNEPDLPKGGPYTTRDPSTRLTLTENGISLQDVSASRRLLASNEAGVIAGSTKTFAATGQTYTFMDSAPVTPSQATALAEAATKHFVDNSARAASPASMLLSLGVFAGVVAGLLI
eukprot:CAMPEP_0202348336 /NCGR_PEP_ID=MMETSP1126-20121109/6309_1 /ASSEMBLY_ACC=CAM_ASM_000457 /TAXON_ID=3047 /ORGANISM="Dunaliella tertiolecta, Strain CCMP1320" /LENGTH=550 /DNA_ID=CAMNT_0048940007 /DNA_START=103 /DNA_END=1755 /DNA_ORIENTATION=+